MEVSASSDKAAGPKSLDAKADHGRSAAACADAEREAGGEHAELELA